MDQRRPHLRRANPGEFDDVVYCKWITVQRDLNGHVVRTQADQVDLAFDGFGDERRLKPPGTGLYFELGGTRPIGGKVPHFIKNSIAQLQCITVPSRQDGILIDQHFDRVTSRRFALTDQAQDAHTAPTQYHGIAGGPLRVIGDGDRNSTGRPFGINAVVYDVLGHLWPQQFRVPWQVRFLIDTARQVKLDSQAQRH
ncbi:hypothetical protein D3C81_627510 [compost metagenome]